MYKKYLLSGFIGMSLFSFANDATKAEIQTTANNIATQLQIPPQQRTNFTTEYTNKSIALQDLMSQNISAQEKATKAKAILGQSNSNLKQSTPSTQVAKYNSYFNKTTPLTASVTNTKPATKQTTSTATNNNTPIASTANFTKNSDYKALPTEHQEVVDNMALQLSLDNNQFQKMSSEYLAFYNGTENIKKNSGNNILKAKTEFDALIAKTNNNVKAHLNTQQYNEFSNLLKSGKLGKDTTPRVSTANVSVPTSTNTTPITANTKSNVNLSEIKSAKTLTELKKSLSLTEIQYSKALVVANKYDAEIAAISVQFPNNIDQQKAALDKKTPAYVNQFKAALSPTQANTYFGVLILQVNILTGKNLSPEYQNLINVMKTQYNMSDVQVIQSMMVLTEAKVKADANKNLNKNNPTAQKQESDKITADIDTKLKNILSTEQYNKVKADITKALGK